jgi:hypothetical protein
VTVAPLTLRLATFLGSIAPGPSAAVQKLVGGDFSERLFAAQRHKR